MSLPDDYEIIRTTSTDATVKVYVPWTFDGVDDLNVWYQNTVTGVVYYSNLGDFTVTTGEDGGGVFVNIENTQGVDPIDVAVARETPKTQTYSLNEAEALNPVSLIEALDKAIKLLQEVALGYDEQSLTSINPYAVPDKVTRAGKFQAFDVNGDPTYQTIDEALQDPVDWATEWAKKAEDVLISLAAGGNGTTDYSSLHHAAKSAASAAAALISEGAASDSAAAALVSENKADQWANEDEDVEVEPGEYSSFHWAQKAAASANPGLSSSFNHRFNTSTTEADPGSGRIAYNNANPALATKMFISTITVDGVDLGNIIGLFTADAPIYQQQQDDAAAFIIGSLSADATDNTSWFTLDINVDNSGILPTNNKTVQTLISPAGGGGGGILPSAVDDIDDADYTVLAGDVGKRKTLINGTVLRVFTFDVSLLADFSEQISFKNESDFSMRIVVSNTGTMKIANGYVDMYLSKGGIVTFAGDTAINVDVVARP